MHHLFIKDFILLFVGIVSFGSLWAQNTITITGQVVESATQEILPFVTVSVKNSATKELVTGTITDDTGRFNISDLPTGDYIIEISYIGFERVHQSVSSSGINPIFDLGTIALSESAQNLSEVAITARRATVDADLDKKSFSLDQNLAQSGGSVLDAMRTMPGVAFDQEGKIVLRALEDHSPDAPAQTPVAQAPAAQAPAAQAAPAETPAAAPRTAAQAPVAEEAPAPLKAEIADTAAVATPETPDAPEAAIADTAVMAEPAPAAAPMAHAPSVDIEEDDTSDAEAFFAASPQPQSHYE
ncbi:hypothetical protein LCGC14_3141150, partial [marine sediment metagenome]